MTRDQTAKALLAGAYVTGVSNLLLFEPLLSAGGIGWVVVLVLMVSLLALWALALIGCFVASWKIGLFALPSGLFALAWPAGMIGLNGRLS